MDEQTTLPTTTNCPECGAVRTENAGNCWLCGWKQGDRLSGDAVGRRLDAKWTFSLSTLFLWMALIGIVVTSIKSSGEYGAVVAIIAGCATLNTCAVAGHRWRDSGRSLSVPRKIAVFAVSLGISLVIGLLLIASAAWFKSPEVPLVRVLAALVTFGFAVVFGTAAYGTLLRAMK